MGETISAHAYMQSVKVIKKIDDIPELKEALVSLSEGKTHQQMSQYGLLLAEHILKISHEECDSAIARCFEINKRWLKGEARFQEARQVAFGINRLAREEQDPVKVKVLRAMGQVAATPHVKWHALVASEYAITLINVLYPGNLQEVRNERETQIRLMESV